MVHFVGAGPGRRLMGRLEHRPVLGHGEGQGQDGLARQVHRPPHDVQGQAMPNLGDVSIYATWGYVMDVLRDRGYETAMVPGVPSFCAAAARLDATLVRWGAPGSAPRCCRSGSPPVPAPAGRGLPGFRRR